MGYKVVVPHGQREGEIEVDNEPIDGLVHFSGVKASAVLRVAANVADAETVTIGSDVYEFDRAANGVTAGRIAVTGHADDTPANATNALITAINTYGREAVTAVDISDNEILLIADEPGVNTLALAETLAGANNAWSGAALAGGVDAAVKRIAGVAIVPNATQVALGNIHIPLDFTPTAVSVEVRVTSTGVIKAWDGAVVLASSRIKLDNAGTTDWAATDTIHVLAFE